MHIPADAPASHVTPPTIGGRRRGALRRRLFLPAASAILLLSCDGVLSPDDASVARIDVTPASLALVAGESRALTARLLDQAGQTLAGRRAFWASERPEVATVSQEGIVSAVAAGVTQIGVSAGGKSAVVPVAVAARPVTVVRVSPSPATVQVGATVTLAAEPLDAAGSVIVGRTVQWTSNSVAIASVAASGVVTGVSAGNATITATVDGIAGSTIVTVHPVPIASVRLTPDSPRVEVGQALQLTATPLSANGAPLAGRIVTFASSNNALATVSSSGLLVGIAPGTATITATSEGHSASVRATVVNVAIARISIVPNGATMQTGTTTMLSLVLEDDKGTILSPSGRTIAWSSDAPAIVTVNPQGLVTAVAPGNTRVRVTVDGVEASVPIAVVNVPVASVSISPANVALISGASQALTAVARDAAGNPLAGRPFVWNSSNPNVATVGATGIVTAVAAGTALVTATSGGVSGSATISVGAVPIASITVAPTTAAVVVGATQQLTATARDASNNIIVGPTFQWTSSAPGIVAVSSTGVVTGIAAGSATITATSPGASATGAATVTVMLAPVASVTVVPASSTLSAGDQLTYGVTLLGAGGVTLSPAGRTIAWSSSNTSLVTIGATSGVATAVAATPAGSPVIITATVTTPGQPGSVNGTATLAVTPSAVASVRFGAFAGTLHIGSAYARAVTAQALDASNAPLPGRTILWSSLQPTVSVSPSSSTGGSTTVTGISGTGGTALIVATASGAGGTFVADTLQITTDLVAIASSTVSLTTPAQGDSVAVGGARSFTATPRDSASNVLSGAALGGRTPTWTLGGAAGVATITPSGGTATATGVAPGNAAVQAAFGAATGSAPLRVLVPATSVQLSVAADSFYVGAGSAVTATALDASNQPVAGRTVTLTSSAPAVASVGSGSGTASLSTTVTGVSAPGGRATATLTAAVPFDGRTATAPVRVLAHVATVTVAAADSIVVGGTTQATATLRDASNNVLSGRPISWSSTTPALTSVSGAGIVTGLATGNATITATAESQTGTRGILVQVPIATITLTASRTSLIVNETEQLVATALDQSSTPIPGRVITFASSAPSVASVSSGGLVTAVAPGTATITASAEGKSSPGLAFSISPIPVSSVSLSAPTQALEVGQTVQATAVPRDAGGQPLSLTGRTVIWTTTNASVVSVTDGAGGGSVRGVDIGSATVSVTVDGVAPPNTLTFTVSPAPVGTVTVVPATLTLASTTGQGTLSATVRSASGIALAGRGCTLASSPPGRVQLTGPPSGASDLNGVFTVTVTGLASHPSVSVTVTCEAVSGTATVIVP